MTERESIEVTEPVLTLIPESFSDAKLLFNRITYIEHLRDSRAHLAAQLCERSEKFESLDIVLRRTSTRGTNQITWRWRGGGKKCISIASVMNASTREEASNILSLNAERVALNYELSVYVSELARLREAQGHQYFQTIMSPPR